MQKNKKLGCIALLFCSPTVMAMQPLDDKSLAQTTGQDGINIGVGVTKVQMNQLSIIDTDGLGSTPSATARASIVMAGKGFSTLADQAFDVSFIGASSTAPTLNLVLDADGGSGKPFANIGVSFATGVTGIKVSPFAFYLAGYGSTSTPTAMKSIFIGTTAQQSDVNKFMRFDDGIDINFASVKPVLNVQLGNTPQSSLIRFGGAIQSICGTGNGCSISLLSDNSDVGASFKFQFKATDASGFSLNGFSAGVDPTGFTFANTGTSSKFDVALNQMTMGTNNATSATGAFNSLANGSMGNFGAVGATVTDLKMKISGF